MTAEAPIHKLIFFSVICALCRAIHRAIYFSKALGIVSTLGVLSLAIAAPLSASPWLENNNVYLRSDLQVLADAGIITVPVNTFPLAWREIAGQLAAVSIGELSAAVRQAYVHVEFKLNAAKQARGARFVRVQGAQKSLPRNFAHNSDAAWGVFSNLERSDARVAMRASVNYASYHDKNSAQFNIDNSYLAVTTGKTDIFFSAQEQWWSPAWAQSLSAEQRVHPAYELGVSRLFLDVPVLGSALVKSGITRLRSGDDWQYASRSRLSLRPHAVLELSTSYFDFQDARRENVAAGGHQWSVDARTSLASLVSVPLGVYAQKIIQVRNLVSGENGNFDTAMATNSAETSAAANVLLGGDYSWQARGSQIRLALEYSEANNAQQPWQRYALAGYVQLPNSHAWEIQLHESRGYRHSKRLVSRYRMLVMQGMLSVSLAAADRGRERFKFGAAWEYRF